jgi:hypothetical protein
MRLRLLVLLKSVKNWVFDLFSANGWVDKEAEHYFQNEADESN